MSFVRSQYDRIDEPTEQLRQSHSAPASPLYQYGSLARSSIQDDPENPLGPTDARVTHHIHESLEDAYGRNKRRRMLWWILAPALVLLVVVASVAAISTGGFRAKRSESIVESQGEEVIATSTEAVRRPAAADSGFSSPLPLRPPVGKDDVLIHSPPASPSLRAKDPNGYGGGGAPETTQPVLGCLEFKCRPLTMQLTNSWADFSNIGLLQCLSASAVNKTEAAQCFKSANPSQLRDDLVACAGCNGCLTLKDQASVDQACKKYAAWSGSNTGGPSFPGMPSLTTTTTTEPEEDVATLPDSTTDTTTSSSWDDTVASAKGKLDDAIDSAKGKIDDTIDNAAGAVDQANAKINDAADQASKAADDAKANTTSVLTCLEDKCKPLTTQLVQSWREIANIQLLRCLASAAVNKTAAGICFDSVHPSELRDDLVACAGCNGCVTLNDQANVDDACAKYDAWKVKQKEGPGPASPAAATTTTTMVESQRQETLVAAPPRWSSSIPLLAFPGTTIPGQEADARTTTSQQGDKTTLARIGVGAQQQLPDDLKAKYCSRYWCP